VGDLPLDPQTLMSCPLSPEHLGGWEKMPLAKGVVVKASYNSALGRPGSSGPQPLGGARGRHPIRGVQIGLALRTVNKEI